MRSKVFFANTARMIGLLAVLSAAVECAGASKEPPAALVRMGMMDFTPVADGRISKEELRGCSVSYGAISEKTGLMSLRYCVFHLGYTDKGVYFAVRSETPPSPQKLKKGKDVATLHLVPPGAKKPVNIELDMSKGSRLKGVVDYGVECVEAERFVSYRSLGAPKPEDGQVWGLQMRISYSSPDETGLWCYDGKGGFGSFIPDSAYPIVSQTHFSPLESWRAGGTYDWEFRVKNTTRGDIKIKSASWLLAGSGSSKLDDGAQEGMSVDRRDVVFNGTVGKGVSRGFYYRATAMWPGKINTLWTDIRANGRKCPAYRRRISWDISKGMKWKDEIGLPFLRSAFYPSKSNRLRARFNPGRIKNLVGGELFVEGPGGKRYFEKPISSAKELAGMYVDTFLGELPLGDYKVRFRVKDAKGTEYTDEKTFSVAKFPWQGLNLGKERVIVPPFKPLVVKDGREVHALQTGFRFGGILWDGVFAAGEQILAAPVDFKMNGRSFEATGSRFLEISKDRVVREVQARMGDLKLTVTQEYDYDGFCDVRMKFVPEKPVKVDSLVLEMSLKSEIVSLFNETVRGDNKRSYGAPQFSLPKGSGVLWTSDQNNPPKWHLDLYGAYISPYVWMGGPEKGFCWLIDSMKGMSLERGSGGQRIVREGGAVRMESVYVNKPVVWDEAIELRMGFQPSPVKPQEPRYYAFAGNMHAYRCPSNSVPYTLTTGVVPKMWPLLYPNNMYPGNDFSLMDYIMKSKTVNKAEYHKKVKEYAEKHRRWFEDHTHITPESYCDSMAIFWRLTGCEYMVEYMNPWLNTCYWPEWEMYKGEWTRFEWPAENEVNEYRSKDTTERIDKILYDAKFALDHGMNGIYYDCFEQARDVNYVMSTGGSYMKKDGTVQMSLNEMFSWRELVKRTAHLCYLNGGMIYGRPYVEIHSTSFQIVPVMGFATGALCFERGARGGEYQDRFNEGYLLSDVLGRQTGTVPRFIVTTRFGGRDGSLKELRSMFAMLCATGVFALQDHGTAYADWFWKAWNIVYDAGWGRPDAVMSWYYDGKPQPVKHDGRDVRVTTVRRGDSALAMFGNLGDAVDLKFDVSGFGFGPSCRLYDAETGEELPKGEMRIDRRGYRLIRAVRRR